MRSRFQTGCCQSLLKKNDRAVIEFVKVEISYPQYPQWQAQAVLEIGKILLGQNQPEQAKERFGEVLSRFAKEEAATAAKALLESLKSPGSN